MARAKKKTIESQAESETQQGAAVSSDSQTMTSASLPTSSETRQDVSESQQLIVLTPQRDSLEFVPTEEPKGEPKHNDEFPFGASPDSPEPPRFRAWVTDHVHGYERFTDEKARQLVLKFAGKPSEATLTQIKDAGFRYQADYFGKQKVWTRPNDFEGRLRLEEIEKSIRGPVPEVAP